MPVSVAKWGNSLGVRIPSDVARSVGLSTGTTVEVVADGNRIIITPVQPRPSLADLLVGCTPEAMRDAFDWGPDVGREIFD